jgi:hypothetical protein
MTENEALMIILNFIIWTNSLPTKLIDGLFWLCNMYYSILLNTIVMFIKEVTLFYPEIHNLCVANIFSDLVLKFALHTTSKSLVYYCSATLEMSSPLDTVSLFISILLIYNERHLFSTVQVVHFTVFTSEVIH